ncbi:hypothetical protein B484DRAFT_391481, partial [Ochromonadaceae sp. CCMP2298]
TQTQTQTWKQMWMQIQAQTQRTSRWYGCNVQVRVKGAGGDGGGGGGDCGGGCGSGDWVVAVLLVALEVALAVVAVAVAVAVQRNARWSAISSVEGVERGGDRDGCARTRGWGITGTGTSAGAGAGSGSGSDMRTGAGGSVARPSAGEGSILCTVSNYPTAHEAFFFIAHPHTYEMGNELSLPSRRIIVTICASSLLLLPAVQVGANYADIDLSSTASGSQQVSTLQGGAGGDYLGNSVSVAGDVNGDGIKDFIVGAP